MTNLIYAEALEKEVEYSIKLNFNSRKVRVYFQGTKVISDTELYEFKSKSGRLFVIDQHIESIELSKPLKAKEKKELLALDVQEIKHLKNSLT